MNTRPVSRRRVIACALDAIESAKGQPLSIEDLCRATQVSERTLRNIFHEYFGVGPMRLVKLRQLREIRAALLNAHSRHDTVTKVAARFGIWDLGVFAVFARNYQTMFGESPATTLRDSLSSRSRKLRTPPAHALVALSKFLLSRTAYLRYVEPAVLDMRHEYYEALIDHDEALARWVVVRGYLTVLRPFLVGVLKTIFRSLGG